MTKIVDSTGIKLATPDNATPIEFFSRNDRFAATDSTSYLSHLDEHGYAVIAGVVSASDIVRARELLWDFLEVKTGKWKRSDMWTWVSTDDDDGNLCLSRIADRGTENGILHKGGAGQSEAAWFIRERVASSGVFEKIWEKDLGEEMRSKKYPYHTTPTSANIHTNHDDKGEEDENDGNENELISSFDAMCIFRPWQLYHRSDSCDLCSTIRTISRPWFHADQGRSLAGKKVAVQGFVTLYDQNGKETTGGLAVLAGSHKSHDRLCRMEVENDESLIHPSDPFRKNVIEFPRENGNYLEVNASIIAKTAHEWGTRDGWSDIVPENEGDDLGNLCDEFDDSKGVWAFARVVEAKAGDLVLWDSRTLHCNTAADLHTAHRSLPPPDRLLRAVVYTCMIPRRWASSDDIKRRMEAYERGWTSTHWPCDIPSRFADSEQIMGPNFLKFYQEDLSMEKEGQRKFKDASQQRRQLIGI